MDDSADLAREALAANGNDGGEVVSNLSASQIDEHLDAILRASGSALRHYSMEKTMTDMRTAVKGLANAAVMAHVGLSDRPVARIKTVGGYPDDSEHTLELLVKYKDLRDGQLLYVKSE